MMIMVNLFINKINRIRHRSLNTQDKRGEEVLREAGREGLGVGGRG